MSTEVTAKVQGMRYSMNMKNCSISQYECNSTVACGMIKRSLATANVDMEECSVSCCHGNLCNAQGGGGTVASNGICPNVIVL